MTVVKKISMYLNESLDLDKIEKGLDNNYIELQKDILLMVNDILEENSDKSIKKTDLVKFLGDYIADGKNSTMIDGLIEDNDLFNFYIKHQTDFDELLHTNGHFNVTPEQNGVFGLYDFIINGTKQGLIDIINIIKENIK